MALINASIIEKVTKSIAKVLEREKKFQWMESQKLLSMFMYWEKSFPRKFTNMTHPSCS